MIDWSIKLWAQTNPFFRNCFCNILFHSNEKVTNTLVSQLQRMKAKADVTQLLPEMLQATHQCRQQTHSPVGGPWWRNRKLGYMTWRACPDDTTRVLMWVSALASDASQKLEGELRQSPTALQQWRIYSWLLLIWILPQSSAAFNCHGRHVARGSWEMEMSSLFVFGKFPPLWD